MSIKHFKNKKDQQKHHAKRRFAERLGIRFSQRLNDMLLNKIHTNQCKLVEKQSLRVKVYEVTFVPVPADVLVGNPEEITVNIVYDKLRKTIVTVLPLGEVYEDEMVS